MKRTLLLFISIFLFVINSNLSLAQPPDDTEDNYGPSVQVAGELELEKTVAERLEALLQPLVGPLVVLVDLNLTTLPVELEGFTYSESESLPGLPVSISENVRQLGSSGWNYNEIGGISIRVFVAESMKEEEIHRVTELIPMWINLNYSRGDQIIVERVPFVNAPITLVDFLLSTRGIIILFAGILSLALLLALLLRLFVRPARISGEGGEGDFQGNITGPMSAAGVAAMISEISESKEKEAKEGDDIGGNVSTNILNLPEGAVSVKLVRDSDGSNRAMGSLSKLQTAQITDLMIVLNNADSKAIAIALNLSRPSAAAEYLSKLEKPKRQEVLAAWKNLETMSNSEVQAKAAELRDRMDSLKTSSLTVSGPEPIAELINQSPEAIGRSIYDDIIKIDESLAKQVRSKVFFLEDVLTTEPKNLRKAIMSMPRNLVAILVKDADEAVKERIFSNLSQRAANLVEEEASLLSTTPPEKASLAKRTLVESLQRFNR